MGEGARNMISVCMATYNGEKYIREQLDSILVQLAEDDELVISDDLSSDKTIEIIQSYKDMRIKLYIHRENHGFVRNFENALKHVRGDIIFLSDQDDVWMPDKVEVTTAALKNCDFTVSDCITINENKQVISRSRIQDYNIKTGFWRLMVKTRYLGCCMAFKRNVLDAALPFPNNAYLMEHDLWLATVAEFYFKTAVIRKPLIQYRRHENNVSSGGSSKGYSLPIKIYRRLYRLQCLMKIRNKVKLLIG